MGAKSDLFGLLNSFPESATEAAFPELSVPSDPSSVQEAIYAAARAQIEIVKWLDSFKGWKIKDLYGTVGMLSPAAQAIAGGLLQSDGTDISSAETVADAIKMIGDESSGGGITGNNESLVRRSASGGTLQLLARAIAIIPGLEDYSDLLAPLINTALAVYAAPGLIGYEAGLVLLDNVADLIKQLVLNYLFPPSPPGGADPLVPQSLNNIFTVLAAINERLEDEEGDSVTDSLRKVLSFQGFDEGPILEPALDKIVRQLQVYTELGGDPIDTTVGNILMAINKRLAIRKYGAERGVIEWPLNTHDDVNEEPDTLGDVVSEAAAAAWRDDILELPDGTRIWIRSKTVDYV
jgi:hypothetical protein